MEYRYEWMTKQVVWKFLRMKKRRNVTTFHNYFNVLKPFWQFVQVSVPIEGFNEADCIYTSVNDWFKVKFERRHIKSPQTFTQYCSRIGNFFRWAHQNGFLATPVNVRENCSTAWTKKQIVSYEKKRSAKRSSRYLTEQQWEQFLKYLMVRSPRDYVSIRLMTDMSLRKSALLAVRRGDFQKEGNRIYLWKYDKVEKQQGRAKRKIVPDFLYKEVIAYMDSVGLTEDSDYLYTRKVKGGRITKTPVSRNGFNNNLMEFAKEKFGIKLSSHDLRRIRFTHFSNRFSAQEVAVITGTSVVNARRYDVKSEERANELLLKALEEMSFSV